MSIINLNSQTDLSGFYISYQGSTNLEKKGIYGISHLVEHLVAKSIDPYQNELDRLGISFNAYTSSDQIVYHMTGLDESLSKWRNKFVDLIGNFDVTKEDFEKEREIVLQEYSDSFNGQEENHWLNLARKRYNNFNAIGLKEDLENLRWIDILNYVEIQYSNPSKIINVSKNVEFGSDIDFFIPNQNKIYVKGDYPVTIERNNSYKDKVSLIMNRELITEDFAKVKFVNYMLSMGLQSPLYDEIREKRGLVYYIGMTLSRMNTQGMNSIYTSTSSDNVDKIVDIIGTIFNDLPKFLTKERFNIVKQSINITGKKQEINRYNNVNKYLDPKGWSVFDIIDELNYEEVLRIANKYFNISDYLVSRDDTEF